MHQDFWNSSNLLKIRKNEAKSILRSPTHELTFDQEFPFVENFAAPSFNDEVIAKVWKAHFEPSLPEGLSKLQLMYIHVLPVNALLDEYVSFTLPVLSEVVKETQP